MMNKKFHEALHDYIKTGGEGLVLSVDGRTFRFRLPEQIDVEKSLDYGLYEIQQDSYILALCLQTVGGFKVSDQYRYDILKELLSTPKIRSRIMRYFWKCVKISQEYAPFFEAFCYTTVSRSLWEEWKNSSDFGFNFFAQDFPLTDLQKSWITFNKYEDEKEKVQDDWSRSFFVASSMNPKGVEKIQKDWTSKKKKDQEYRAKLIEEATKGNDGKDTKDTIYFEKSVEDLQKEYWDWVEGREDEHDLKIRQYKEQVQDQINKRKDLILKQQQDLVEMNQQVQALNSLSMSSPIRAYTDEEVAQMTQNRSKRTINFDVDVEYADHLNQRYLQSKKLPGQELPSLMEQVQQRQPKYEG